MIRYYFLIFIQNHPNHFYNYFQKMKINKVSIFNFILAFSLFKCLKPQVTQDIPNEKQQDFFNNRRQLAGFCEQAKNICTIKNQLKFNQEISFFEIPEEIEELILEENSSVVCKTDVTRQDCVLTIRMKKQTKTKITLKKNSLISGRKIIIESQNTTLELYQGAKIMTSMTSFAGYGSHGDQGASFVGQGGYCGTNKPEYNIYGSFDFGLPQNPIDQNNQQIGSVGQVTPFMPESGGGGFIYLNIQNLIVNQNSTLQSFIQANGGPDFLYDPKTNVYGGTGGYIYIRTNNTYEQNLIDKTLVIQANGGFGKNQGYGGSGGIIILEGKFQDSLLTNIQAFGGPASNETNKNFPNGCANGAAGTIWLKQQDLLFINNNNTQTNQITQVKANKGKLGFPNDFMVSQNFKILGQAVVSINNQDTSSIIFNLMSLEDSSKLIFNFFSQNSVIIKYRESFKTNQFSTIDFLSVKQKISLLEINDSQSSNITSLVQLGKTLFSGSISIQADNIILQNHLTDPKNLQEETQNLDGKIELIGNQIQLQDQAVLKAGKIFIYAKNKVEIAAKIDSLIMSTCQDIKQQKPDFYQCIPNQFPNASFSQDSLISYYNQQFGLTGDQRAQGIESMKDRIMWFWSIQIITSGDLIVSGADIEGSRISFCANSIFMNKSFVSSGWRGCKQDDGVEGVNQLGQVINGNAPIKENTDCAGAGGSHGGNGGYGGIQNTKNDSQVQCQQIFPKAYYFGKEATFEGSGGTSGDFFKQKGGKGGGIIWLTTPGNTSLYNSRISSEGQPGILSQGKSQGSGGGAGGSIQITTLRMVGNSTISIKGGSGSNNGGGGGAGGRFVMNYLKNYLADSYPAQSFDWLGKLDLLGGQGGSQEDGSLAGQDGQNGTIYHSKCFPGYSGAFCEACPIGYYKHDYSFAQCTPCINKPTFSSYQKRAQSTTQCSYECAYYLESAETNPDCLDPLTLQVQRMGGALPFFSLLAIFLCILLIVFSMLSHRSQIIAEELKDLPENLYLLWDDEQPQLNLGGKVSEDDLSMNDDCIWAHTHRMYLIGENSHSITKSWFIPKDFPRDALKKPEREKFLKFIDQQNPKLQFTTTERNLYYMITFFYPPLAENYHMRIRRKKFMMLQRDLFQLFPSQFWIDKQDNKTFRFSCSLPDYRMAYIDFLDFSQKKNNWLGLKLPMPILLAGNGSFNSPFKLDYEGDVLAKSIVLVNYQFLKDKLPIFNENFNSELSKVNFRKLDFLIMQDIRNVVHWVEKANRSLLKIFGVKAVIYIIENQYTEVETGIFKQKRRSFPLETIFFDAFPDMYSILIRYVKERITSGRSEIRLAMVFKKYTKNKHLKTEIRINMMKEGDSKGAYKMAVNRQESVLFDETDNDELEETIISKKNKANYLNEYRQSQSSLNTDFQLSQDPLNKKRQLKLVDKTKRAFSISIESSKAFELAIRKPRLRLRHRCVRLQSWFIAVYLLLFKMHGTPQNQTNLNFMFIWFAVLIAVDLLLLINFTLHIFFPITNFINFGFLFIFFVFGAPYFSPALALVASFKGKVDLLRTMSNMNSLMILINIPLVVLGMWYIRDDPVYFLLLAFFVLIKIAISASSAKIRQYLMNPRYQKNAIKLKKILVRQSELQIKKEQILGKETILQLEAIQGEQNELEQKLIDKQMLD